MSDEYQQFLLKMGILKDNFSDRPPTIAGQTITLYLKPNAPAPIIAHLDGRLAGKVEAAIGLAYGESYQPVFEVDKGHIAPGKELNPQPDLFSGFSIPTENWSKLPHSLIGELNRFTSLAELKVVLYVLRHTWGYHETEKLISMDEFMNGRRTKNAKVACACEDCRQNKVFRIDHGLGMSKSNILNGIKKAIDHGFLIVRIDDSDKGRTKKFYSLNYSE